MGKLKVTFFSRQNLNIHFHWQIVQQYAIQDEFTQKTQDLNPKCKEDSKQPNNATGGKTGILTDTENFFRSKIQCCRSNVYTCLLDKLEYTKG